MLNQREIVDINFRLPGDIFQKHPVIIISNNMVNQFEGYGIGVMLSSTPESDKYSFWLKNSMLTKNQKKRTQVRCHLIAMVLPQDVIEKHGYIKQDHFNDLINHICMVTF